MPSQDVHDFWSNLTKDWQKSIQGVLPEIQIVGAKVGNAYQAYQRGNDPDPDSQLMLRLYPSDIDIGDRVMVVKSGDGGKYILGKFFELTDTEPEEFDPDSIWVPYWATAVALSATTTSSTTVYSTKINSGVTLPTGTWDTSILAWAGGIHTANGSVDIRLTFDGVQTVFTRTFGSATGSRSPIGMRITNAGVAAGANTLMMEVKCNTAGTVSLFDGQMLLLATRVS